MCMYASVYIHILFIHLFLNLRVSSPQREGRPGAGEVRFQRRRCDLQLPGNAVVRCHLAQSVGEHAGELRRSWRLSHDTMGAYLMNDV